MFHVGHVSLKSPFLAVCSPGEFGSERLVQSVVDMILRQTAKKSETSPPPKPPLDTGDITRDDVTDTSWRSDVPSKMIITGRQVRSV